MADVPEYDGYLEVEDDQLREALIQLNENIRSLQKRIKLNENKIADLQTTTNNLEATKANA